MVMPSAFGSHQSAPNFFLPVDFGFSAAPLNSSMPGYSALLHCIYFWILTARSHAMS